MEDNLNMLLQEPEVKIESKVDDHQLTSESCPYVLTLRRKDNDDEKELFKFIKSCERSIRTSPEYRLWTDYVREVLGQYSCVLTGEVHAQTNVDIHHHPVSLYSITKAVITRYEASSKEYCSFDICTDVIELHYQNRVGYIPLLSSLHDKFHKGFLQIPIELVHGEWRYLTDNYNFDDDDLDIIQTRTAITKDTCNWVTKWKRDAYPNASKRLVEGE